LAEDEDKKIVLIYADRMGTEVFRWP